ncbi:MAG: hypothetical protein PHC34_10500 [Candidatus Gastranaerophilales bacterium]|nr:hypothetical protein [Candidatus Gastranaerophilales bacterium]
MNNTRTISEMSKIIEALGRHSDGSAVEVLEEIGTNSPEDIVRELTVNALISRNTYDSLKVVLINEGKGIHDLSATVAESAINSLKSLNDKSEVFKILDETINTHYDDLIKSKATFVKDLITSCQN